MICKLLTTENCSRTDEAIIEISKLSLTPEVVYAVPHDNAKMSFNRSMRMIMSETNEQLLFFEDDVLIKDCNHFYDAISQLPEDWEICYLGANLVDPIERYSDNLYCVSGAWTTHAVMIKNPSNLGYNDVDIMFDQWLRECIHPRGNTYIVKPMIAWQKPHISYLWNHFADYTDIFNNSANKLV